jgi:hypothetical protein
MVSVTEGRIGNTYLWLDTGPAEVSLSERFDLLSWRAL